MAVLLLQESWASNCVVSYSQSHSSRRVPKKKTMKATWNDSESDSKEEVNAANVCFMAHGDDPTKVYLETSLDNDELATFFEEL